MKFAILGISHETNTFSIIPATYEEFEKSRILRGQEMADQYGESEHTIAGYLQARSGNRYAVVALQNHTDVHRGPGEEVQAALLRWLYEQ